jgi:hypothetical protein
MWIANDLHQLPKGHLWESEKRVSIWGWQQGGGGARIYYAYSTWNSSYEKMDNSIRTNKL